jgi:hypothetical protein
MSFGSDSEEIGWNDRNTPLKWPSRIVGGLSAVFIIVSQEVDAPALSSVGKCFFWSGLVLLQVFGLNRDLYSDVWAWFISFLLVGLQIFFIKLAWGSISHWNFIELTAGSFVQAVFFFLPFLVLRRYRGLTYPPVQQHSK